jgi:hypothetical protein
MNVHAARGRFLRGKSNAVQSGNRQWVMPAFTRFFNQAGIQTGDLLVYIRPTLFWTSG